MKDLRPLWVLAALALTACHANHYSTPRTDFIYDPVNGTRYWPNIGIGIGFSPQPRYDDTAKSKD